MSYNSSDSPFHRSVIHGDPNGAKVNNRITNCYASYLVDEYFCFTDGYIYLERGVNMCAVSKRAVFPTAH